MMIAAPIPAVPSVALPKDIKPVPSVVAEPIVKDVEKEEIRELPLLHELSLTDRLLITRRLPMRKMLYFHGKKNEFYVRTPDQNIIYTIEEHNKWWVGYICFGLRPLQLCVKNGVGEEVMRINRPFALTTRLIPCQLQSLEIFSPPGHLIGTVHQQWTTYKPLYMVLNGRDEPVFFVRGPKNTMTFYRDVEFQIERVDGSPIGATYKHWQGLMHALFFAPILDRFGVTYDQSINVEEKALLMAVTILFDYMYYDA